MKHGPEGAGPENQSSNQGAGWTAWAPGRDERISCGEQNKRAPGYVVWRVAEQSCQGQEVQADDEHCRQAAEVYRMCNRI